MLILPKADYYVVEKLLFTRVGISTAGYIILAQIAIAIGLITFMLIG
jgi:hypothetical protein